MYKPSFIRLFLTHVLREVQQCMKVQVELSVIVELTFVVEGFCNVRHPKGKTDIAE
jgi:hypothetical protein